MWNPTVHSIVYQALKNWKIWNWFFTSSQSVNFCCLGLLKVQLPIACPFNSNAYNPQAIRSYIDSLLQVGYQICAPPTILSEF